MRNLSFAIQIIAVISIVAVSQVGLAQVNTDRIVMTYDEYQNAPVDVRTQVQENPSKYLIIDPETNQKVDVWGNSNPQQQDRQSKVHGDNGGAADNPKSDNTSLTAPAQQDPPQRSVEEQRQIEMQAAERRQAEQQTEEKVTPEKGNGVVEHPEDVGERRPAKSSEEELAPSGSDHSVRELERK